MKTIAALSPHFDSLTPGTKLAASAALFSKYDVSDNPGSA